MKIRIEEDILSGTGAEIMDQLRARVFDPTEFPDTESYIWFLRNSRFIFTSFICAVTCFTCFMFLIFMSCTPFLFHPL